MKFRDLVLYNFWWKLLSLLVAVLMWLTIQTALRRDENLRAAPVVDSVTRSFSTVPITLLTSTKNLNHYHVSPPTVEVEISGAREDLAKLQEKDVHAFVNISEVGDEKQFRRPIEAQVPGDLKIEHVITNVATVERIVLPSGQ
jgi:YbbR domain-containing protein